MPIAESASRAALALWAVVWLPGLAGSSWRFERLLRAGRRRRACAEAVVIALVPVVAFALYALPDAQRHAQAHGAPLSWRSVASVLLVALPYAVSAAHLLTVHRPGMAAPRQARWWLAGLLGLLSVLLLAPGLLMTQLMLLAGT